MALRDHKTEEALHNFHAAIGEPSIYWSVDSLETCLADALLELGRWDDAIIEYRRILSFNQDYLMARYRLGVALEHKQMIREARGEFKKFLTIWKDADADIPQLVDTLQHVSTS